MRNFSDLSALWRAPLFSKAFYQDVGQNWRGIGLRYLMLILAITWLLPLVQWTIGMSHFLVTDAKTLAAKVPTVKIEKGIASSPVKQPYIVTDDRGRAFFVIDTTGATKMPSDVGAQMLLTQTELIQDQGGRVQIHSLKDCPDMTIDSSTAMWWFATVRNLIIPVLWPTFWVFSLAYRLILALLFAAIGLGFAKMFGGKISYAALLRLAIVSMTTSLILGTIFWMVPAVDIGCFGWFIGHLICLGYLLFAVKVNSDVMRDPATAFPVEPQQWTGPAEGESPFP